MVVGFILAGIIFLSGLSVALEGLTPIILLEKYGFLSAHVVKIGPSLASCTDKDKYPVLNCQVYLVF